MLCWLWVLAHLENIHKTLHIKWGSWSPAATTAERFFRIDRGQEHLHYVTDISSEDLYILDPEIHISFMQNRSPSMDKALNGGGGGSMSSSANNSSYSLVAADAAPVLNGHKPLQRLSNRLPHNTLTPPTTVIVQDTSVNQDASSCDSQVKMTFSMPVTPPKSPGWVPWFFCFSPTEFQCLSGGLAVSVRLLLLFQWMISHQCQNFFEELQEWTDFVPKCQMLEYIWRGIYYFMGF